MPLKLHELIKKAESKGITALNTKSKLKSTTTRPWQEESILFNNNTTTAEPPNQQQTGNKATTVGGQTSNKTTTKSKTNQQQNDNKNQNGNKPAIISRTKAATYQQQIDNVPATEVSLTTLVGLQRALLMFIYYECKKARSKSTKSLTLEYISGTLKSSKGSIKTTLQRIEAKGFIKRTNFKIGRGGWSQYSISDVLFQELLQHETDNNLTTNWKTTDNKVTAELAILPPVVSSSLNTITTTNIPIEMQQIDYAPLAEVGFNETHIIQIYREHTKKPGLALSSKIIQDSINALAYDLKHNSVANDFRHSPAVVLTALLKKGMPYSSKTPEQFLTPQEEAMQNYFASKERQRLARQETEHKIKNLEYQEWQENLTEEELLELCPESEVAEGVPEKIRLTMRRRKALDLSKDYFDAEIWPKKKHSILNSMPEKA